MKSDNIMYALNCLDNALHMLKEDCRPNSNRYEWTSNAQITLVTARKEFDAIKKQLGGR